MTPQGEKKLLETLEKMQEHLKNIARATEAMVKKADPTFIKKTL